MAGLTKRPHFLQMARARGALACILLTATPVDLAMRRSPATSAARSSATRRCPPRAQFAHAARSAVISLDNGELIIRMIRHDLGEMEHTIYAELARCLRTIGRVAMEESSRLLAVPRPPRNDELLPLASHGTTLAGGLARRRRVPVFLGTHAHELVTKSQHNDGAERGALGREAIARVGGVFLAQRARISALLGSYVHWRRPLLLWWLWHEIEDGCAKSRPMLAPLSLLLAPALVPTLASLSSWLARTPWGRGARERGLADTLALSSSSTTLPELQEAILHLRPQIIAKIRHALRCEPAAWRVFVPLAIRLLVLVPLMQLTWRCGSSFARLSDILARRVLMDAFLASERCNRVERARNLPPLRPPGGWRVTLGTEILAVAAAAVGQVGSAVAQMTSWASPAANIAAR